MPPHKVKRGRGRPKRVFGGEQDGAGRPSSISKEILGKICESMADGLPLRYAANINGIAYETAREWQARNKNVARLFENALSLGINKYRELAAKQGSGWKLLKSLDKGREYSDEIRVTMDEDPIEVVDDSGGKSVI